MPDPSASGPWHLVWLVPVGVFAGVVNTVAGGGSFVTLAVLVWLGVPAPVANATNRVGVLAQSGAAALGFRAGAIDGGGELAAHTAVSAVGAVIGALLSLLLDPSALDRVLGVAMIALLVLALARPTSWTEPGAPSGWRWPALLLVGVYGGFAQAGVGIVLLPTLVVLGGLDPVRANARKVLLVGAFTAPALAVYAWAGLIDWSAGAVLAVSSAIGGAIGARVTVGYGARFVWAALVAIVAVNAVRLAVSW